MIGLCIGIILAAILFFLFVIKIGARTGARQKGIMQDD